MILQMVLFCMLLSQVKAGDTQVHELEKVFVTLKIKNAPVKVVFDEIEKKTSYGFAYEERKLAGVKPQTVQVENQSLLAVLEELSKKTNLRFKSVNKTIHVTSDHSPKSEKMEDRVVKGVVISSTDGLPVPGTTVMVKGTQTGTATDVDGNYVLAVPDSEDVVLRFSFVGFETQEILLGARTQVNVTLVEDLSSLEEVVVTDFGNVVKKTDMIGAVQGVAVRDLKIPSSNLTTALSGRVAGMIAYQRSGEPGMDNADFFIRGITTFGANIAPLILIDNVEVTTTDLARLQVDDLESFTIMKDATATAIYGARGANGVVLVTTKRGVEGKTTLDIRLENSISAPTRNVELADPVTYMRLTNEAISTRDPLSPIRYPLGKIDRTAAGGDPMLYPAVNWMDELVKPYAVNQRVNVNVRGGGKVARFFVSGAFNQDNGVLEVPKRSNFNNNISLKNYSLRSNVDMNLTETTELLVRLNGSFDEYTGPMRGGADVYKMIMRSNPVLFQPYYPPGDEQQHLRHIMFGNAELGQFLNPYAELVRGYKQSSRSMMLAQVELRQNLSFLTEGLNFRFLGNTTRRAFFDINRSYMPFYYSMAGFDQFTGNYRYELLNELFGSDFLDYSEGNKEVETLFYMESALNYNQTFKEKHNVSGMMVFILRNSLRGNAGSLQESLPFRNLGLSGRSTYNYDNRYYAEFNFGYNGSERFHESSRWGFFPSAGLAWSISNEEFFYPAKRIISKLRVRGTYGMVGNDRVARDNERFLYLSEINMNNADRGAIFGLDRLYGRSGISVSRYSNPYIGWEKSYKTNMAIELGLFDKFEIITDIFKEHRTNIYMNRVDIPTTMGLATPIAANIGEVMGRGIDVQLNGQHSINHKTWIQMMGNFTYATSEYLVYEEPDYPHPWLSRVGHNLRQEWGFVAERLFVDDQEVANSPQQLFGNQATMGGDIKYFDTNGDGRITDLDRVPIGHPTTPEINYGFGLSFGRGDWDFSCFFQGSARSSFWIDSRATAPFIPYYYQNETLPGIPENALLQAYADSYWSEENRDIYALWPRLSPTLVENNMQRSTWFMRNGSFLRLKQVEVGYSLPSRVLDKIKMRNLRIYANGTNLMTWSKFKLWDVEMAGNGLGYPIQRVVNLGLHASF
ncbi:SusC/RagA family TonB-linked outer membrane protein [Belliella marina]|uniref:SusC/RagA family TonB-linked outer membrane protein n=1 Tax=Belliella marina TaxID=1644146 RepID=A0ABW4VK52_9BACT